MKGSKRISELITNKDLILPGRINIIEANVSAGKTHFIMVPWDRTTNDNIMVNMV